MHSGVDDLLKTMSQIGATDLALIPSVIPMMRVADTWRGVDMPPLTLTGVRQYADQLMSLVPESARQDGRCEFAHEQYGHFRLTACGYPDTLAVLLIRVADAL